MRSLLMRLKQQSEKCYNYCDMAKKSVNGDPPKGSYYVGKPPPTLSQTREGRYNLGDLGKAERKKEKRANWLKDFGTTALTVGSAARRPTQTELEAGRKGGADRRKLFTDAGIRFGVEALTGEVGGKVLAKTGSKLRTSISKSRPKQSFNSMVTEVADPKISAARKTELEDLISKEYYGEDGTISFAEQRAKTNIKKRSHVFEEGSGDIIKRKNGGYIMATAVDKLKCGGMKRKGHAKGGMKNKGYAKGGSKEDDPKKPKPGANVKFIPTSDQGKFFSENIDDPASYSNRELFGDAGEVAGVYNEIKWHGEREGLTDWRAKQAQFLRNADKYSDFYHGMRQADLTKADTDFANPGIIGDKGISSPIAKDSPEGIEYLKQRTGGLPLDINERKGVNFAKRWHRYHGLGGQDDNPKAGTVEQVYDIAWGKDPSNRARVSKDIFDKSLAEYKAAGHTPGYQEGGEIGPENYDYDSLTGGTPGGASPLGSGLSSGIGMVGEIGSDLFAKSKARDIANYDPRDDPSALLGRSNAKDTGGALLKGAAKGAAAGVVGGPIGVAIGAAAGLLVSGLGRLIGKKGRDEETERATSQWSQGRTGLASSFARSSGYKDGGEIKGKGTAKSDSIKMTAEDGSFIVPAENKEAGMDLGKTYLGWDDKTVADRSNGGDGIKVSDGEVFFTPDEVGTLKYYGINLDDLAPNAEPQNQTEVQQFQQGGWKFDSDKGWVVDEANDIAYDQAGNEYKKDTSGNMTLHSSNTAIGKSIWNEHSDGTPQSELDKPINEADPKTEAEEFSRKWYDYVPELAGTIQSIGGAAGLIEAGKAPDLTVSHTLKRLSAETRRLAQFGYEPQVLNALDNQIEKARRDVSKGITDRGGSPGQVMANLQKVLGTTIDKKAAVLFENAKEKTRKWADVIKVDTQVAGQEFDIQKLNLDQWYKTQDVYANMLAAGISNIVGARQLKTEQDAVREIGTNKPTYS